MRQAFLKNIENVNTALQRPTLSIAEASKLLNSLQSFLAEFRDKVDDCFKEAKILAEASNIEPVLPEKQTRKVKRLFDENADDEIGTLTQEQKQLKIQIFESLDKINEQFSWKFNAM